LDTYGLDASLIEAKIGTKTKAIILQHLYGLVCRDYLKIIAIAKKYKLKVIEDCAHSTGAKFNGMNVGNLGDLAFYSTEQSKVMTTIQGGVAITNDMNLAQRIKEYYELAPLPEKQWIKKQLKNVFYNYYKYKHSLRWITEEFAELLWKSDQIISTTKEEELGIKPNHYGCRMPSPIGALGINQLKKIDNYNALRRRSAQRWDRWCEEQGYRTPYVVKGSVPVYLRYPVLAEEDRKNDTSWGIDQLGVRVGVWFKGNIHPTLISVRDCPNADKAVKQCINFPCLQN
jgi:dTDP-4-amino-4,6-dideoxygalactose transaminase